MAKAKELKDETTSQKLSSIVKSCRQIMRKDKGMNGDADRLPMLTWIMFLKFLDDNENFLEVNAELQNKKYKSAIESPYRWKDWAKNFNLTGDDLLAFINNEKVIFQDGTERPGLLYYLKSLQSETGTERKDVISTVFKGMINRMINGYLLRDVVNKIDAIHFTSNEELNTLSLLYESLLKEMRDASGDAGEFYTPRPVVKFMVEMLNPQIGETILDPAAGTGGFLVESFEHLKKQTKTVQQKKSLQENSIIGGEAKPLPYLLCQMNLLLHGLEFPNIDSGNSLRYKINEIGDSERVDIILTNPPFGGEEERGILNNFPEDKRTSETAFLFLQLIMRKLKRKKINSKGGRAAVVVPNGTLFADGIAARIKKQLLEDFYLHTIVRLGEGVFAPYTDIQCNIIFFEHGTKTEDIWYYELLPQDGRKKFSKTKPIQNDDFVQLKEWWNNRTESENAWNIKSEDIIQLNENQQVINVNLDIKNPNRKFNYIYPEPIELINSILEKEIYFKSLIQALELDIQETLSNNQTWEIVKLSHVLTQYREEIWVDDTKEYNQLTNSKYEGVILRGKTTGADIGRKRQFVVNLDMYPNTITFTRQTIQADEAIGFCPPEVNGCIVTENMPLFTVKNINPKFLDYYFKTRFFLDQLHNTTALGTSQKTIHEDIFLNYEIPLPPDEEQIRIIDLLEKYNQIKSQYTIINHNIEELFPSILNKAFKGEL